jgi:zinc protease
VLSRIAAGLLFCLLPAFAGLGERITEYDLANGLHVIIYTDSSAPVVSTNAWYRVGAYFEPPGRTGISHMTEHMTFKKTPVYPNGEIHALVKDNGGYNNGFTSTYYSGYYEEFAADRWELALRLEAARMGSCIFTDADFVPEKEVVTEEWRLGDNRPTSRLWTDFDATAFQVNPQRNPVIGWPEDIRRFTRDAVEDWYRTWYNPANAVLVIAGDVRPEHARSLVQKHFGRIRGTRPPAVDWYDAEPEQRGERRVEVRMRTQAPTLLVGYRMPGVRDTVNWSAARVAAAMLGDGRTSRLYRRLVVETGLASSFGCWTSAPRDPGLLMMSATPRDADSIPAIERIIAEEVARLGREPADEHEIERVRNGLVAAEVFNLDDPGRVARILASTWLVHGDWREYERGLERTRRAGPDDVLSFAARWLRPELRTVGLLLPPEEGM